MLKRRHLSFFAPAILAAVASGCIGDIGGDDNSGPPGPPIVEPIDVAADPDVLTSESSCFSLNENERLVSVSAEGHAWLMTPSAEGESLRVADSFGDTITEPFEVKLPQLSHVQAWTGDDAAVLTGEGLWRLEELARVQLTPPTGLSAESILCGDPSTNGILLSGGGVFERRDDNQWWGWDPGATDDAAPTNFVRYDGECLGLQDNFWMTSPNGTVWNVEATEFSQPIQFEEFKHAAATEDLLAVLDGEGMWLGPEEWQSYRFPNGLPTELSASNGVVWMVSGGQLLRFDGTDFAQVTVEAPPGKLFAYAGGVFTTAAGEVCHHGVGTMVRVEGLRSYSRSLELEYDLSLSMADAGSLGDVVVEYRGEELSMSEDGATGTLNGLLRLENPGWHEILISVAGELSRNVRVKRLSAEERSWDEDILPIYENNCVTGDCHGTNVDAPDLSTYEAWQNAEAVIRTRVVEDKTMPPAANQGPEWGEDKVTIVAEWLEGGMKP